MAEHFTVFPSGAPNPSLHLTFASPLRGLSPAGELKR